MTESNGGHLSMIDARVSTPALRRAYNWYSHFYGALVAPLERKARMLALARANIKRQDAVLEVAVGPGVTFLEILRRVDSPQLVYGVDLSPGMLRATRQRSLAAGYAHFELREADARSLPFGDGTFDVVYNSYMLDLIPLGEMPRVLSDFRRVLKPGGRLALANFSKRTGSRTMRLYEAAYSALPAPWVPYVAGGCRPVLMAGIVAQTGFHQVDQEFVPGIIPSEVVTAVRNL